MKAETCETCGTVFEREVGRRLHLCPDCRMARFAGNAAQSHAKQGPYWEKVVRGQLARWKKEAEALGIDVDLTHGPGTI